LLTAHGWQVKTRSISAFRDVDLAGEQYSLALGDTRDTRDTRERLRPFAEGISDTGVRLSQTLLQPLPR
jgi:hypothetical protein